MVLLPLHSAPMSHICFFCICIPHIPDSAPTTCTYHLCVALSLTHTYQLIFKDPPCVAKSLGLILLSLLESPHVLSDSDFGPSVCLLPLQSHLGPVCLPSLTDSGSTCPHLCSSCLVSSIHVVGWYLDSDFRSPLFQYN